MSLELSPCPFCGAKPEYTSVNGVLWLRCSQCRVGIDPQWYGGDLGVTEESWNKRTVDLSGNVRDEEISSLRRQLSYAEAVLTQEQEVNCLIKQGITAAQARIKVLENALQAVLDEMRSADRMRSDAATRAEALLVNRVVLEPKEQTKSNFDAACDAEIVGEVRRHMREVTGGNCTFSDDDIKVFAALAKWAIENGVPDEISPNIIPRAKIWLAGGEMARAKIKPSASFVWKALNKADSESAEEEVNHPTPKGGGF